MTKQKETKMLAVQANKLIFANSELTMVERRLFHYILAKMDNREKFENQRSHEIKIRDFAKIFKLDEKSIYSQLRTAIENLWTRDIRTKEKNGDIVAVRLLTKQRYNDGSGYLSVTLSPEMAEYCCQFKDNFTKFLIEDIAVFKSAHGLRLFEILTAEFQRNKSNKDRAIRLAKFTLDDFRFAMGLVGKYPRWASLERAVIAPAVAEISEKIKWNITIELVKESRNVVGVIFRAGDKSKTKFEQGTDRLIPIAATDQDCYRPAPIKAPALVRHPKPLTEKEREDPHKQMQYWVRKYFFYVTNFVRMSKYLQSLNFLGIEADEKDKKTANKFHKNMASFRADLAKITSLGMCSVNQKEVENLFAEITSKIHNTDGMARLTEDEVVKIANEVLEDIPF